MHMSKTIGILGTGMVGRAHATRLSDHGYHVLLGTPDPVATRAESRPDQMGNEPFPLWHTKHEQVELVQLKEAAAGGELVINALKGEVAEQLLTALAPELGSKILIDIANPLDFSQGMPPFLSLVNTTSLGERIQAALPKVSVVKTLNTTNAFLQVDPTQLHDGEHTAFMSGNDAEAKRTVRTLLTEMYGWKDIIDLGDITTARGTEMFLPLWLRTYRALDTPMFNIKVVR